MENLETLTGFRRDVYSLLAYPFYKEITPEYGVSLVNIIESFALENIEDEKIEKGIAILSKFKDTLRDESKKGQWAKEFTYTFLVPENKYCIKPYGSFYLSSGRLVMQDERDKVLEFFANHSRVRSESFKEPDDHIGAELSFMSTLAASAFKCLKLGDKEGFAKSIKAQSEFLDNHILNWIDMLAADMQKADEASFYAGLAVLTQGFVAVDREILESLSINI